MRGGIYVCWCVVLVCWWWPCGSSYMRIVRPRSIPTPTVHSLLLLLLLKSLPLPPARSLSRCAAAAAVVVVVAPHIEVSAISASDPNAALPVPAQAGQNPVFCGQKAARRNTRVRKRCRRDG